GYDDPMGAAAAPEFSAAAPMFAKIGYNFVAQTPPIATFGAGAQNAPPYFGFVVHRILFPFASRKIFLPSGTICL
ncbi:MAG: hypothetical protein AAB489_00640, partial [Patescibacteria group bacterium]